MKIEIIAIGKMTDKAQKSIAEDYLKRLKNIKITEIPVKNNFSDNSTLTKKYEFEQISKYIQGKTLICLSEEGDQFDSNQFAHFIKNTHQIQQKTIAFIIGGASGLDPEIKKQCHKIISLGKMTFPHMIARIILIEQIYRANTILQGHPYHK